MARVVCIHGIAQQYFSREQLLPPWSLALCGGVSNAGFTLDPGEVDLAFYGEMFRPPGRKAGATSGVDDIPEFEAGDLESDFELQLLAELSGAVVDARPAVAPDDAPAKLAGGRPVLRMLQVLAQTPFFGRQAQKVVIWYLKQVYRYVNEPLTRSRAQHALASRIGADTRAIVAHSLGSVVAYEALRTRPDWPVTNLITLGSPLGIPALIPRLLPPVVKGQTAWPAGLQGWENIADQSDIVALRKELAPVFDPRIRDTLVHNGADMHDVAPYLSSRMTGMAIAKALRLPAQSPT